MSRLVALALALVCGALLAVPAGALAAGSPNLGLTAEAPDTVLLGRTATVNLTANNPAGQPYGYNLTFRDVLPAGVSYVPGSATYNGAAVTPQVIVANAGQPTETTTLIWRNVGDLSPNSRGTLTYQVAHATSGPNARTVGQTYAHDASSYINTDERTVPAFNAAGVYTSGASGSDAKTAQTNLSAVDITVQESSPEGELLRGAHDHQTVYTLHLENNLVAPTGPLTVETFLPAGLEFLGCGQDDNTTDAPTNPGSDEEWPGAGPLAGQIGAPANCDTPAEVATVVTDPDAAGPLPSGVYTRVRWTNVPALGAGGTRNIRYVAAVPLRQNTTTWTGATPTPAGLQQGSNLDNNNGPRTQDEQTLHTHATAAGNYNGVTPSSDRDTLTRTAEDIRILKDASQTTIADGQLTRWTLRLDTGEYRYVDDIRVTDTVPDGLCPLASPPLNGDADCAFTAGNDPSAPYDSTTENAHGSWTLAWDSSSDPALTRMQPSAHHEIEFSTRSRSHYQENGSDERPVLARDRWTNTVSLAGADYQRCIAPADCGAMGTKIDTASGLPAETDLDGSDDGDVSEEGQVATAPTIDKTIRTAGGATPVSCSTGTYTNGPTGPYGPGDRVCYRLRVDFPGALDTGTPAVTDFLPPGTEYESYTATGANTVTIQAFDGAAGDDVVTWTLGAGPGATNGQVFEVLLAARVVDPTAGASNDVKGNLMKFAYANSGGESFPLRDQVDFTWSEPQLTLTEGVRDINNGSVNGPNVDGGTVQAGDVVTIRVDVSNVGTRDATNAIVWERLPSAPGSPTVDCTAVSNISDGGSCAGGVITWPGFALAAGTNRTLTYDYTVPSGVRPQSRFNHRAGVRTYQSADNTAGTFTYFPTSNIDPTVTGAQVNTTAADDPTHVATATPSVTLTRTTGVNETGNDNTQATIGERIEYTSTVTIPQGTTLSGGPSTYTLPLGSRQTFVPGSLDADLGGGAVPGGVTIAYDATDPANPVIRLTFPDGYTNASGSGADVFTIRFHTTVDDEAANSRTAPNITQSGTLSFRDSTDAVRTLSPASVGTQLVEPLISLSKDENDDDDRVAPAQVVRYTLTLGNANAARVSRAHETAIVDTLPAGITPVATDGTLDDGDTIAPDNGVWNAAARTITFNHGTLNANSSAAFRYDVRVDDPQTGNAVKVNNAVAYTTSHPGAAPGTQRAGTLPAAPPSPTGYRATASDTVRLIGATLTKSVDAPTATVGGQRDYTLEVTLPGGLDFYDVTVRDLLPDGLDYEPATFASVCVGGCGVSATALPPTANGDGSTQLGFFLGDVPSSAGQRVVRITYSAHVDDRYEPENTPVVRPNTLQNTAALYSNQTDAISGTPSSVPAPGAFTDAGANQQRTVTVTEPQVTIDKDVSGQTGDSDTRSAQPGDALTYTLTVANTGNHDAHDVVSDQPDAELVNVTPQAGSGLVTDGWTAGDPDIAWTIPTMAAGASVTLTYTAEVRSSATLHEADQALNIADVPEYFAHPLAYRQANPTVDFRDYDDVTPDTVTIDVDLPRIEVDLTTGRPGFPESGNAEVAQDFPWRAVVRNTSPSAGAHDADLSIRLPRNWMYTPGSAAGAGREPTITPDPVNGDLLTWTDFADIPAGGNRVVTFDARPTLAAKDDAGVVNPHVARASVTADDVTGASGSADGSYADGPDPAQAVLLAPDLAIAKTPENGDVNAGATGTWTIGVANNGGGTARDVRVTDTIPAGVSYTAGDASSANPGFGEDSVTGNPDGTTTVVWRLADLAPGGGATITVPVRVPASDDANTVYMNSATVSADEQPTGPSDTGALRVRTRADLRLVKTANPTSQNAGDPVSWTITATNDGPSDARAVVLTDTLPADVSFVSFTQGGADCQHTAGTVTCSWGTLAPGASRTVEVVTRLASSLVAGTVTNTATVNGSTTDPTPGNNTDSADVTVGELADLEVVKSVRGGGTAPLGQDVTYDITVTDNGPTDAHTVELTDALPAGTSFRSLTAPGWSCVTPVVGATGTVTCTIASFAAGASAAFELTVRAEALGTVTNIATVDAATPDPDASNDADDADVDVVPATDLAIVKTGPASVQADGEITYTLTASNDGPSDATDVTVTDTLPAGVTFRSAQTPQGTCSNAGDTVTCALGDIAAGDSVTLTVVAHAGFAVAGQTVVNAAEVTGAEVDVDPSDNADTHPVQVGPAADVSLVKSAPERVPAGGQLLYTLQVGNAGGQTATGVEVTDVLPDGLTFVSAQPTQGACEASGQAVRCQVGSLAAGGGAQVLIAASVARELVGQSVRNVAAVDAVEPDPDTDDRSDDAVTTVDPEATLGSLAVSKTADDSGVVRLGRPIGFTISVHNESSRPATGVVAIDDPSVPVDVVSAVPEQGRCDERSLRCELGTIPAGGTVAIRVVMIPRRTGTLENSVMAFSDQGDAQASDNLDLAGVTVRAGRASFKLAKRAARRTVKAGGRVAYTVRARNASRNAAANVRVCDAPRAGLSFARIKGARLSRGSACWTVRYWKAGETRTFRLVARVNGNRVGKTRNVAVLRAENARKRRSTATVRAFGAGARGGGVTG